MFWGKERKSDQDAQKSNLSTNTFVAHCRLGMATRFCFVLFSLKERIFDDSNKYAINIYMYIITCYEHDDIGLVQVVNLTG